MSEKMAGIFAINVVNEKDYMEINGKRIERKENYENKRSFTVT